MLRAVQVVVDEKLAKPILIGRPEVIEMRIEKFGLRIKPGKDFELVNLEQRPALPGSAGPSYYQLMGRDGVSPDDAKEARAAQAVADRRACCCAMGDGDALLCGTFGKHKDHLRHVANVIGLRRGRAGLRGDERAAAAQAHAVHLRHLRQRGSDGRAARRDHA